MVFLYIAFILAEYCRPSVDQYELRTQYRDIGLAYSKDGGSLIEVSYYSPNDQYFEITGTIPFFVQFYIKNEYCPDFVKYQAKNMSEKCNNIKLYPSNFPEKCKSGVSIKIQSNISFLYKVYVVDRNNDTILLEKPSYLDTMESYSTAYFEPFTLSIYLNSTYYTNDTLYHVKTIYVNEDNMEVIINNDDIPMEARPYIVRIHSDLPYFHKIGVKYSGFDSIVDINQLVYDQKDYLIDLNSPEIVKFYLLSTRSCYFENGTEILSIKAEQNYTRRIITMDDIPKECQEDYYPNDDLKYQPDDTINTKSNYSFIFSGKCDRFDDLVEGCKNGSVNYPLCPFVNDAIDSRCSYYDDKIFSEINPLTDKLYIVISSSSSNVPLHLLKHKMIVHIKGTDFDEPEIYFRKYDEPSSSHYIYLDGDLNYKVNYLIIENIDLRFRYNPLIIDNLYLKNSTADYDSTNNPVYAKNIYVENSTIFLPKNYINQYTIVLDNTTDRPMYQIQYEKDYLQLCRKDWFNETYDCKYSIGYKYIQSFGLIAVSHFYDINIKEQVYLDTLPPINITLMTKDHIVKFGDQTKLLSDKPKYHVNVTSSGIWDDTKLKSKVYFTAYHDFIELETDLHQNVNLSTEPVYTYHQETYVPLLYQPLNYTDDTSLISYIILTEKENDYSCSSTIEKLLSCRWKDCPNKLPIIDYIIDAKCAYPDNIDETLATVPLNVDKVYILNDIDYIKLDLNKLSHQVVVEITSTKDILSPNLLDEDLSKLIYRTIMLEGKISNKVSYLTVTNSFLHITGSPLNTYGLKLLYSSFKKYVYEGTQKINVHDLVLDFNTHVNIFYDTEDLLDIKQYCLIVPPDEYTEENDLIYRIQYETDKWSLFYKTNDDDQYYAIDSSYGYVPYSYADTVCLLVVAHNFEFYINTGFVKELKNVNITLINPQINTQDIAWVPVHDSKYNVSISATGDYWTSNLKANIDFTAFHDLINLTVDSSNLNVIKSKMYNFPTHPLVKPDQTAAPYPSESPVPTSIPIKTPVPEFIESLYEGETKEEIKDVEKLNSDLDEKFNKLKEESPEGNKIVIINAKSFPFQKELDEDQYIKPITNSKIDFIDGNLNLVLPDHGDVTISLNNKKDAKLALKGSGTIAFENSQEEIKINNKAQINGTLNIKVPSTVNNLYIDSVDLSNESSIKCNNPINNDVIPITIYNLNVDPQTRADLYTVNVNGQFTLSQSSHLELHDVNLKESKIVYNVFNLYEENPVIFGEIGESPSSFDIFVNENPSKDSKLYIARGSFDNNKCKDWGNKIQYNGKKLVFDCIDYYRSLDNIETLIAYFKDPSNSNNGGNGLPKGGIIGIVIGVIVVVIIVVVVIVVVVIKKKKNNNNSSDSMNEGMEGNQDEV